LTILGKINFLDTNLPFINSKVEFLCRDNILFLFSLFYLGIFLGLFLRVPMILRELSSIRLKQKSKIITKKIPRLKTPNK
jgi:hypothetical protein